MKVGDLVMHESDPPGYRIGIVIKLREGAYVGQPLVQVFWPHLHDAGWVDSGRLEVVNEGR